VLFFSPTGGHLGPDCSREITVTFSAMDAVKLSRTPITCSLRRIAYTTRKEAGEDERDSQKSLWGLWDDSMKSVRPASETDLASIATFHAAQMAYDKAAADQASEKSRSRKSKALGPAPPKSRLHLGPESAEGVQMVYEIIGEPAYEYSTKEVQKVVVHTSAVADHAKFRLEGNKEILFPPTFMIQSAVQTFKIHNESNVSLPVRWRLEDSKRRATVHYSSSNARNARSQVRRPSSAELSCPFDIEPGEWEIAPNSTKEFRVTFLPTDAEDFVYLLRGETSPVAGGGEGQGEGVHGTVPGSVRMVLKGTAKRPLCHFDIVQSPDYVNRRSVGLRNELGLISPIVCSDLKIAEVESVGIRSKNPFQFYVINTTTEGYEFNWTAVGEPSSAWKCVTPSGMLPAGKRLEAVFEYVPEDCHLSEAFFKLKLSCGVEQLFLFVGTVSEPKVFFSTSKVDFLTTALGGEGAFVTIYLENTENVPFQFSFDRSTMLQLEGDSGPIIGINPKSGTVAAKSRMPVILTFKPQEEVLYNFNIRCEVKKKPSKLSLNVKGEGYAVHPVVQLMAEDSEKRINLKLAPAVNHVDFGTVQVHDKVTKKIFFSNSGKHNFDYIWNAEHLGSMVSLTGSELGGTLQKGVNLDYSLSFCPIKESSLEGSVTSLCIAGKVMYNICTRGVGVSPALRFSFMHYDFGSCFATSPGGSTVVETVILKISNMDQVSNISVECGYQKTRALWVHCPPTMIAPGGILEVSVCFAPRDVAEYAFSVPFLVNGSGKVNVTVAGKGAIARLELANPAHRKITFGAVNIGTENRKNISLVNKSKKPITLQLINEAQLSDRCVSITPSQEVTVLPKESLSVQIFFSPNKRVGAFSEDVMIKYAGLTRKLLLVTGKAQGREYSLDSDSLSFGSVVEESQKVKKLSFDNSGDLPLSYKWDQSTFGPHLKITPLEGKVAPGGEVVFDVTFRPTGLDLDIRQDNILLSILGSAPLHLTCTGSCIVQPTESPKILQFSSLVRKEETKTIRITNPTDKDWFLSPSLKGENWKVPHEFKVGARGAADLPIMYLPLTMCPRPQTPGLGTQRASGMQYAVSISVFTSVFISISVFTSVFISISVSASIFPNGIV
jgi:hydrocephalus-inducing protein